MPIYTISRRPDEIPDLIHWFDAADISTINNGSSDTNLPYVLKLQDKVSSMLLSSDTHGDIPTLVGPNPELNYNTGIYFSGHPGRDTLSGLFPDTSFNTKKTIFYVFTTKPYIDERFYCYKFSILNPGNRLLSGAFGGWPNISLYTKGDSLFYLETPESLSYTDLDFGKIPKNEINIVSISTDDIVKSVRMDPVDTEYLYTTPNGISLETGSKLILGDVTDVSYTPDPGNKPYANQLDNIFCEMLIYNRALTEEEVNKVNQYLKTKWIG